MRKNLAIVLGLAIPVVMVLLIALSIYVPRSFSRSQPAHNFLFVLGPENYYRYISPVPGSNMVMRQDYTYEVVNGALVQNSQTYYYYPGEQSNFETRLYVYDVKEKKSKEVSFSQAKAYRLDPSSIAPDGYEITFGNNSGGMFSVFYGGNYDYNSRYLRKGFSSTKLNLPASASETYYYNNNFRLLGWVVN